MRAFGVAQGRQTLFPDSSVRVGQAWRVQEFDVGGADRPPGADSAARDTVLSSSRMFPGQ